MAPMGEALRSVTELYLKAVRFVVHLEPHIPKLLPLKCAALQRLASARLEELLPYSTLERCLKDAILDIII